MNRKLLGKLITIDEAIEKALEKIRIELRVEEIPLDEALNRIIAEDFYALRDQPDYNRSTVDGFAVRSIDVVGASSFNPVTLRVKGVLSAGDDPKDAMIGEGEAYEVYTGAPLPRGADAVVMYEDTRIIDESSIEVYNPIPKYGNVSRIGEDYTRGTLLVEKNTLLKPWHLAIISGNGVNRVKVYEKLRIGVINTGDEVVEPGHPKLLGKIYDTTGVLVRTYLAQLGFTMVKYYGVFPDDEEILYEAISKAAEENHIVATIGGTSVGGRDVVRDIVDKYGKWIFRGVAMRPGRPTSLAVINNTPLFMLSGYPVAAWTGLEALFTPIIYGLLGVEPPPKPAVKAVLKTRLPNRVGYRSYIRVRVWRENDEWVTEPYMLKGSGILSSLVKSNGYIILPENVEGYDAGEKVTVYLL